MAHNSFDGHVGYIVWPRVVGSRKTPGMPSQCLVCPEVAISQRIHLWEGKSASNQACEISNASPDRCGQEPWVLVALWGKAAVVTVGNFVEHACPAVGRPGRNSRRPCQGLCRRSIGERRNWLFPLGYTTVRRCWMLLRRPGSHCQMFCCKPSWQLKSPTYRLGCGNVVMAIGFMWIASVELCRRFNDLISCNVYAQRLSLWLFWRLIDQWPFQPLMDKRGKVVLPAQDWPS